MRACAASRTRSCRPSPSGKGRSRPDQVERSSAEAWNSEPSGLSERCAAVHLQAGDAEARDAVLIERGLPRGKLFKREHVTLASFLRTQHPGTDRDDDRGLAPTRPSLRLGWRQAGFCPRPRRSDHSKTSRITPPAPGTTSPPIGLFRRASAFFAHSRRRPACTSRQAVQSIRLAASRCGLGSVRIAKPALVAISREMRIWSAHRFFAFSGLDCASTEQLAT